MRLMRGSVLFVAGTLLGIFVTQPTAAPKEKLAGLRLNHVGIYVKDLDESRSFYTKKMGFREAFSFKDSEGNPVVYLQINRDTFLEMTPANRDHPAGFSHVGIWADDLKTTVVALQQQGVKLEEVRPGMTKATLTNMVDPNGVRLELLAYPPESLQKKAIDAWK